MPMEGQRLTEKDRLAIAELHFSRIAAGQGLRNLRKRQVSRVEYGGARYIVKAYRLAWWQRIPGLAPARETGTAMMQGFTPPCAASFNHGGDWLLLVFQDAGDMDFYNLMKTGRLPEGFEGLYRSAGRLLASIHGANLFHADAKTPNFVINRNIPDLPDVLIVDCDRIVRYSRLPRARRVFNIAQFLASSKVHADNLPLYPDAMNAFLEGYSGQSGISGDQLAALLKDAMEVAGANRRIERHVPPELMRTIKD